MKISLSIYILISTILFSCGQKQNNQYAEFDYDSESYYEEDNFESEELNHQSTKNQNSNKNIKGYQVISTKFGIPVGVMPIPNSWKESKNKKDGILFESSDGVKVYGERFKSHFYSNNQQQNYYAQQGGSVIQPPKNISIVIQEDIKPYAESQGLRLVNQFPIPQLAQFDKRFDSYLFKSSPENKQYQCIATEWEDQKGGKSLGIIRYFTNQYTTLGGMDWGYTLNSMGAPKNKYEQAKKAFINSLVNFQINPHWVQTNNQYYAKLTQQSNTGHQQRMAAINTQGQAIINNGNTSSSILDSNHESWKRINGMQDAGHSNSINSGIWERSTVSNPSTGQTYQVEGQNSYYYGNNNNEYIRTDDAFYNANMDNTINNQEWTQYEIED